MAEETQTEARENPRKWPGKAFDTVRDHRKPQIKPRRVAVGVERY